MVVCMSARQRGWPKIRTDDLSLQYISLHLFTYVHVAAVQVSVEVMDVLMKYGTAGVAGLVLRREFVEAVEVLKRLSGVDK